MNGWTIAGLTMVALVAIVASVVDWRHRIIPDRLSLPAYPVVVALLTAGALSSGNWAQWRGAMAGGVVAIGLYALAALAVKNGLGWGDVKLSGLLGLALGALGWPQLVWGLTFGFVAGGLAGLVLVFARGSTPSQTTVAFAPWMTLGALAAACLTP